LVDAQDEHQVWGNRMRRYATRPDSPEYQEAFTRSRAAHNNVQHIRAQLKRFGIDV
jgi:hypothetical protein